MEKRDKYIDFLIAQAQDGRKNPFLELIDFYKEQVFLLSLKLTGNIKSADKITNEIFAQAWNYIKLITQETPLELWLHGLTISLSLADYRKLKESKSKKHSSGEAEIEYETAPDKSFLNLEQAARNVIILHDLEGYAIADIAEITDEKDFSVIENHLNLGRKTLADESTNAILNSLNEDDWNNLISDFETWDIESELTDSITDKLKIIVDYRVALSKIWACNLPSESLLDTLKKKLFDEGKELVNRKNEERTKLFTSKETLSKRELKRRNKLVKEISTNVTTKRSKRELSKLLSANKYRNRKIKKYLSIGIVAVFIFGIIWVLNNRIPSFKIVSSHGNYSINKISEAKTINLNDMLETGDNSELTFSLGEDIQITLYSNTNAFVYSNKSDSTKLKLGYGKIIVKSMGSSHVLLISTQSFTTIDDGSQSIVEFDKLGNGAIKVKNGRVFVKSKNNIYPVFKSYVFNIGDAAPHYERTSGEFINALRNIKLPLTFNDNLKQLLVNSTEQDALTLWCLLNNSKNGYLPFIFEKLNSYFPIIGNVTKTGVVNQDRQMMETWLDDIEWQLQ